MLVVGSGCSNPRGPVDHPASNSDKDRLIISVGPSIYRARHFQMVTALPKSEFRGTISSTTKVIDVIAGGLADVSVPVQVTNNSSAAWSGLGDAGELSKFSISVGYHIYDDRGQLLKWDGKRTQLPGRLNPGTSTLVQVSIEPPDSPGKYLYVLDLVQEGVAWFGGMGSPTLSLDVTAY